MMWLKSWSCLSKRAMPVAPKRALAAVFCCVTGCSWTVSVPCVPPCNCERLQEKVVELEREMERLEASVGELHAMIESHFDWSDTSSEDEETPAGILLEAYVPGGGWQ